ncbi:MarR family winged helix-turn-helix transcriptional regulator [Streptomyces sp. NPDC002671]
MGRTPGVRAVPCLEGLFLAPEHAGRGSAVNGEWGSVSPRCFTASDEGRPYGLFAAINRRYTQESEAAAAAHDVRPLHAKALLATEEPVPMRRIADRLHAEPSNVTVIIDRLESRGLVERSPDPGDRCVSASPPPRPAAPSPPTSAPACPSPPNPWPGSPHSNASPCTSCCG